MEKSSSRSYVQTAVDMAKCFPHGLKPHTNVSWRSGPIVNSRQLKHLENEMGYVPTHEECVTAAKNYVASFFGNFTNLKPLFQLIWDGETPELLSYTEHKEEVEKDINSFPTWEEMV